jgi:hypothetical protein
MVGWAVTPGVRLTVPIITVSDIPAGPIKKVLALVMVGFSVKVPAVMLILMGMLSDMDAVKANAPPMDANGRRTDPVPVLSEPLTATQ